VDRLTSSEKECWIVFIVSMLTRHKKIILHAEKLKKNILDKLLRDAPEINREDIADSNQFKLISKNMHKYAVASISGYQGPYSESSIKKYTNSFAECRWYTIDFSRLKFELITSDYPVCLYKVKDFPNDTTTVENVVDLIESGSFILSFPLSPTMCFFFWQRKIL